MMILQVLRSSTFGGRVASQQEKINTLSKFLKYAGEKPPEGNVDLLLVIGATSWSFKSNCQQHRSVSDYALKMSKQDGLSEHKKKDLLESIKKIIMIKTPNKLRNAWTVKSYAFTAHSQGVRRQGKI